MRIQHDLDPLLPVAKLHASVHRGGVLWGLEQMRGWTRGTKFVRNSYVFVPMDRLHACRGLPLFVLGVWACWMLLGRDVHYMMGNEAGE